MLDKNYRKARRHVDVSVGESVRIMRELQQMSQNELAVKTAAEALGARLYVRAPPRF